MKPLVKWTIGPTNPQGYESLEFSISSFQKFYDAEIIICHNCPAANLPSVIKNFELIDQRKLSLSGPKPIGVAWKLYPPRIDINRHELSVDNDLILNQKIDEIENFFTSDSTLLLEDNSRTYGRFESHVPLGFQINSGLYGMPPGFDLEPYIKFYAGKEWQKNAFAQYDSSETFDEQGLIALALLNYTRYVIISNKSITNCENQLNIGQGCHFIGLNRNKYHVPYRLFRSMKKKIYL